MGSHLGDIVFVHGDHLLLASDFVALHSESTHGLPVAFTSAPQFYLKVQGSGFRVQGSGFRVQGSGFRVQGSGFRVQGSGFRVQGSGFRVQGLVFTGLGKPH